MDPSVAPVADLERLLEDNRARMSAAVRLRMDARIRGRLSPSDVVQDAYVEATRRFAELQTFSETSPVLWLRFLVMQHLQIAHRKHLGVRARSAALEASLGKSNASAENLLHAFAGSHSSPSQGAMRAERVDQLRIALEELDPLSREILAMRHFECLSNRESAQALGIKESTASQRYARALLRMRDLLEPAGSDGEAVR
jgi:RNA polymerase sigma-70 factor (ECF subfamily)